MNTPTHRPPAAQPWVLGLIVVVGWALGMSVAPAVHAANASAQVAAISPAPTAVPAAAPAPATAGAPLPEQAARWLAQQLQLPADRITVQAPDPRMRMPLCAGGVKFDTPFSNANTVRARCESPAWQLFMRASWPEDAVANAPGNPVPAGPAPRPTAGLGTGQGGGHAASPRSGAADTANRSPQETRRGVMLSRSVPRGALLSPASVEFTPVPAREADSLLITDVQALEQVEAVRDLPAGVPLRHTDVRPAVLVRQGQSVTMTVGQGTGFVVTVRLEALQDGRLGDRVMLRNAESGRTVSGVVTGLNSVKGA